MLVAEHLIERLETKLGYSLAEYLVSVRTLFLPV